MREWEQKERELEGGQKRRAVASLQTRMRVVAIFEDPSSGGLMGLCMLVALRSVHRVL